MGRVVIAEYDAAQNALRLAEAVPGLKDHDRVRVAIEPSEVGRLSPADALARLQSLNAPAGDIDQMLAEIEAGRR
ncbi:MAG TPA: hypothetical protein VJZ76_09585 [Thermoanaerobaculia bacterium]|nr:hypothetical protein [Thermoanaerobaculia bacterium]